MTFNKETSNEGFENKLPFSVLLCIRVHTNLETLILTCIDVLKLENGFHIFYQRMKVSPEATSS